MNEPDSDGQSGDDPGLAKYIESEELIAQQKLIKRAKKRAREEQEANRLIEAAGEGPRSAKKKGLEDRVWLEAEGKRQSPRKASNSNLKKSDTNKPKAKVLKKATAEKKSKVPTTRRSVSSPIDEPQPHQPEHKSKGKSARGHGKPKGKAAALPVKRKRSKHSSSGSSDSESAASRSSEESELTEMTDEKSDRSKSDEGESDEFDKDLSDAGLNDLLESEQPVTVGRSKSSHSTSSRQAAELFEIPDEDVMAIDHKQGSSSSRSHPPTSDSEDPPSSIQGSWIAVDEDAPEPPSQAAQQKKPNKASKGESRRESAPQPAQRPQGKPNKTTKASDARMAKFRDERASIVSAEPLPTKADKRMKSVTEAKPSKPVEPAHIDSDASPVEDWPAHTKVNGQGLREQNIYIRTMCHQAIKIVEKTLVSEQAWPELHRVGDYRVEVLTKACKDLENAGPEYRDIRRRVKKDDDFAKKLGGLVIDRLPHHRGPIRASALDHIAVFQLGVDETCAKRVTSLLAADTYVYPGHWETDAQGNPKWLVRGHQIYLNSGIINILRSTFFSSPSAIGFRHKDLYRSSHPDRPEHELTIPLVALAATGIHSALDAWKDGLYIKKKSDKFDGETYKTVYNRHVSYLEGLKTKNLNAFHSIMSELHERVVGNLGQESANAQAHGDALSVLDLSGFD